MGETEQASSSGSLRQSAWFVRRRRLLPWVPMLLGLALVIAGASKVLFPSSAQTPAPIVLDAQQGTVAMDSAGLPDVLGLDEDIAVAALGQAGVAPSAITTEKAPYAAPPGTVVAQDPVAGSPVTPETTVSLMLASDLVMPDVVGQARTQALNALTGVGVVPVIEEVVRADHDLDEVVTSTPAAGEPVTGPVTLQVTGSGDAVFLSNLRAEESSSADLEEGAVTAGNTFMHSVLLSPRGEQDAFVDYVISTHGMTFEATLGTLDSGDAGPAVVTIAGDGKALSEVTVDRAETRSVRVELTGMTRLVITASVDDDVESPPTVVLGDARVTGTTAGIDAIVAASGRN